MRLLCCTGWSTHLSRKVKDLTTLGMAKKRPCKCSSVLTWEITYARCFTTRPGEILLRLHLSICNRPMTTVFTYGVVVTMAGIRCAEGYALVLGYELEDAFNLCCTRVVFVFASRMHASFVVDWLGVTTRLCNTIYDPPDLTMAIVPSISASPS
jgi:hypothetical protein